ncbi:alpha/beta fold hydrolase [Acetobacter sp.]|uniref:alpha/beta fold hydrolase n=1 Tax=Acetobacter sp. TaxID=440 RepID=UPI0025BF0970|nr:alpha/beta hydrolase [Acetobacter sp.]MCH4091138.1 alpha/beta hydrolase [Acetobacter sp.]MCI1301268.1 alpha/beta hydrolase [Acetobacter sp.]MCI1317550.1 alpha/beta hydrolase [Acetobacter sp.]
MQSLIQRALCAGAFLLVTLLSPQARAEAKDPPVYGAELQGFSYPWPVADFSFQSQQQILHMAYMDVRPDHPNGQVAVLLHGKNFCAATWENTIHVLVDHGYRVIAPDQIGFCKSSKPHAYQFSFGQLASNTNALLKSLNISRPVMIGHSTGGMLAIRYALMFPQDVSRLVLVDPVGLEDWQAKGVPYRTVDAWYARERGKTADQIRAYERKVYYADQWKPVYEPWVQMLAGMYRGPDADSVAWNSALLYDMIATQPVVYDLPRLRVSTTLMIGDKDVTAIGSDGAPADIRAKLGHYPELGRQAASAIPDAKLVEFPDLGHTPQLQDPVAFHKALLQALDGQPQRVEKTP